MFQIVRHDLHALAQKLVYENFEIYMTVEITAARVSVARYWMRGAVSDWDEDSSHRNVLCFQKIASHGSGTLLAELLIFFQAELLVRRRAGDLDHVGLSKIEVEKKHRVIRREIQRIELDTPGIHDL